ncbi:hypothetical protein C6Y62_03875 [Hyphomicrobium sulfonivorans]|nr:hypothetical protein [Hyphomicrobium sulfonivorans]
MTDCKLTMQKCFTRTAGSLPAAGTWNGIQRSTGDGQTALRPIPLNQIIPDNRTFLDACRRTISRAALHRRARRFEILRNKLQAASSTLPDETIATRAAPGLLRPPLSATHHTFGRASGQVTGPRAFQMAIDPRTVLSPLRPQQQAVQNTQPAFSASWASNIAASTLREPQPPHQH